MEFDFFDFDGDLLRELYAMLDPRLAALTAGIDPERPEEFAGFDMIEHICGVAAVSAQRYIDVTCRWAECDREAGLELGPTVGETTKPRALWASANFWKHSADGVDRIRPQTRRVLQDAGISFDHSVSDQTTYLVSNVFHLCDYHTLDSVMSDLKAWTNLVFDHSEPRASRS